MAVKVDRSDKNESLACSSDCGLAGWPSVCHSMYATSKAFAFQHFYILKREGHVKIALLKCMQLHLFVQTQKSDRPKFGAVFKREYNENAWWAFVLFESPCLFFIFLPKTKLLLL